MTGGGTSRALFRGPIEWTEERYRAVVEQTSDGICVFETQTARILETNHALQALLGYSASELASMTVYDLIAHDCQSIEDNLSRTLANGYRSIGERRYRRKDGNLVDVEVRVAVMPGEDPGLLCAVVNDITERKVLEERLRHEAAHDPLTGLANRAASLRQLDQVVAQASGDGRPVAVLFIDLDDFKKVNGTFGHHYGDMVLTAVADRLRSCVRGGDLVARIGGDEFTVLVEYLSGREEVTGLAERLTTEMWEPIPVGWTAMQLRISASIGVSMSIPSTPGGGALLRQADTAMYRSKEAGKGCWELVEMGE